MRIPTSTDVAKLLNAAEPTNRPTSRPGFTAYVALCAFAGLRRGEALVQVGDGKDLVDAAGGITVAIRAEVRI